MIFRSFSTLDPNWTEAVSEAPVGRGDKETVGALSIQRVPDGALPLHKNKPTLPNELNSCRQLYT
jgi:hypothetical protein